MGIKNNKNNKKSKRRNKRPEKSETKVRESKTKSVDEIKKIEKTKRNPKNVDLVLSDEEMFVCQVKLLTYIYIILTLLITEMGAQMCKSIPIDDKRMCEFISRSQKQISEGSICPSRHVLEFITEFISTFQDLWNTNLAKNVTSSETREAIVFCLRQIKSNVYGTIRPDSVFIYDIHVATQTAYVAHTKCNCSSDNIPSSSNDNCSSDNCPHEIRLKCIRAVPNIDLSIETCGRAFTFHRQR